jgi:hypothetical protein
MEEFKEIPGFEDYLISNNGRLKTKSRALRYVHAVTNKEHFRVSKERFLKTQYNNRTGYKFYQLYKDKKMHNLTIHRLVAIAFIDNPNGFDCVNHKDGNKHNNVIENLEWCTNEYNHEHATKTGLKPRGSRIGTSKLNEACVKAIKNMLSNKYSQSEIARIFEVSRATIILIGQGKTWNTLTGQELTIKEPSGKEA